MFRQIYKGKLKLRIKKECPFYGTKGRSLEKVLFYKFGWSVSLWTVYGDNGREFSDWAKKRLEKIFPGCTFDSTRVLYNGRTYYPNDAKFLFNDKYDFKATDNWQVFFDKKNNVYVGYSNRACCAFGIGDMLFSEDVTDFSHYYKIPKYRRKYLLALLKYHLKDDAMMFEDMCEDNIIGHGISQIIPFRERGNKVIETLDEAYQAACNFAAYVS